MAKNRNHMIHSKSIIEKEDYKNISKLESICSSFDKTNLKLELDFKMDMYKNSQSETEDANEFFYFADNALVGYVGILSFAMTETAEINGMVHPNYRRQGIFTKLFLAVIAECKRRKFKKILLLSDNKSVSGTEFIKSVGGIYESSEYQMEIKEKVAFKLDTPISLRVATKKDLPEIWKQNCIYFGMEGEFDEDKAEILTPKNVTYMVELESQIIGKIKVDYSDDMAFIYGFGILPEFRGRGLGRQTLMKTLLAINEKHIYHVQLEVACQNATALNLYTSCGFKETSVMDYYEFKSKNT